MPHPADPAAALAMRDQIFEDLKPQRGKLDAVQRRLTLAAHAASPPRITREDLAEAAHCVAIVLGELSLRADGVTT